MSLIQTLRLAFSVPKFRLRTAEDEQKRHKQLVGSLAHGNVLLQFGRFVTKEDIDVKFDKYRHVSFTAGR